MPDTIALDQKQATPDPTPVTPAQVPAFPEQPATAPAQNQAGSPLVPALAAGGTAALAGGVGIAQLQARPRAVAHMFDRAEEKLKKANDALREADINSKDNKLNVGLKDINDEVTKAQSAVSKARQVYHSALHDHWDEAIKKLPADEMVDLYVKVNRHLAPNVQAIPAVPNSPEAAARDLHVKFRNEWADTLEAANYSHLTPDKAFVQINKDFVQAYRAFEKTVPKSEKAAFGTLETKISENISAAYAEVEPQLADKVKEATAGLGSKLGTAETQLARLQDRMALERDILNAKISPKAAAAENILNRDIPKLRNMNKDAGFFSALRRPVTLLRHGSGGQKFAVAAGALVAMGATATGILALPRRYTGEQADALSFQAAEQARNVARDTDSNGMTKN